MVSLKVLNYPGLDNILVKCRLPWTWAWLQATLELRFPFKKDRCIHQQLIERKFNIIQYHLNASQGEFGASACIQFLSSLYSKDRPEKVADLAREKEKFGDFLKNEMRRDPTKISLINLKQLLSDYTKFCEEDDKVERLVLSLVETTVAGQVWSLAINYPIFFRAAPILFPRKIMAFLPGSDSDENGKRNYNRISLLDTLEEVTKEAPWKLGFSDIMYEETKVSGLEAAFGLMKKAWFWSELEEIHKAALLLYDAFKSECRNRGHTFLLVANQNAWFDSYLANKKRVLKDDETPYEFPRPMFYDTAQFLQDNKVLVHQVVGAQERFHLARYWRGEEGIIDEMWKILREEPWELPVDLTESQFSRIQADAKQMQAARSIVRNSITLISGRGGTGKTEVVSAVLADAEEKIEEERKKEMLEARKEKLKEKKMSEEKRSEEERKMSEEKKSEEERKKMWEVNNKSIRTDDASDAPGASILTSDESGLESPGARNKALPEMLEEHKEIKNE